MKAPPFAYARASSLDDALELLHEAGDDAKLLAGGQSLLPLLAYRVVRPSHLVDIDALDELTGIRPAAGDVSLGALTRHAELERAGLEGAARLLALAASHVGHLPIRNRGTLGGSLAHADPAAELPVAALALDAGVVLRSRGGERRIPVAEFFVGPFTTAIAPGEMITEVVLPADVREGRAAFKELAVRSGDFALAAAGVTARVNDGRAARVRIALGGVDATPVRAMRAEAVLEGRELSRDAIAEAAHVAASACDPVDDAVTSAAYRRRLVERLVRDALTCLGDEAAG